MKHTLLTAALCLSFYCLSAQTITPQVDSIPFKKWNFGLQTSFLSNFSYSNNYQLGMFTEYRLSKKVSVVGELNYSNYLFSKKRYTVDYQSSRLDLGISAKYRFGRNNDWYSSLGYYRSTELSNNYATKLGEFWPESAPFPERNIKSFHGAQFEIGKEFLLKNGASINVGSKFRYDKLNGMHGGLKLGYSF